MRQIVNVFFILTPNMGIKFKIGQVLIYLFSKFTLKQSKFPVPSLIHFTHNIHHKEHHGWVLKFQLFCTYQDKENIVRVYHWFVQIVLMAHLKILTPKSSNHFISWLTSSLANQTHKNSIHITWIGHRTTAAYAQWTWMISLLPTANTLLISKWQWVI